MKYTENFYARYSSKCPQSLKLYDPIKWILIGCDCGLQSIEKGTGLSSYTRRSAR